jgi:hypothetical protein
MLFQKNLPASPEPIIIINHSKKVTVKKKTQRKHIKRLRAKTELKKTLINYDKSFYFITN